MPRQPRLDIPYVLHHVIVHGIERRDIFADDTLSLTELLNRVCVATGVEAGRLQHPGRQRAVARARAIFCCLAVQEFGYTGKDVGTASGLGSAGVCIAVQRGEHLLQSEPALREKIIGS
jgi:hypothetical protein